MSSLLGRIIVIKRNGSDGAHFPLRAHECLFGRNNECDIRIQLPTVSKEHAKISVDDDKKVWLENLSACQETLLNGSAISGLTSVSHLDVFTISDRSFRFEFPTPKKTTPKKSPKGKKRRSSEGSLKRLSTGSSPRIPVPVTDNLKENINILRRESVPLQEVDESLLSPLVKRSPLCTSGEMNNLNTEMVVTPMGKRKSPARRQSSSKKTKRVSFGTLLSPELFDKTLPVATPVKKGATPRRLSNESKPILTDIKRRRSVVVSPSTEAITEEDELEDAEEPAPSGEEMHVEEAIHEPANNLPCESSEIDSKDKQAMVVDLAPCVVEIPTTVNTNEMPVADNESPKAAPSVTPRRSSRRLSSLMMQQIEVMAVESTASVETKSETEDKVEEKKRRLSSPVTKAIEAGFQVKCAKKKLATPLRKAIQSKPALRETKRKLGTPIRKDIHKGIELKATKKKLATPLRQDIQKGVELKATKQKLATPLRKEIQSKPILKETKKKLATPLRKEIQKGVELKATKLKLATPLRKEIQSKPILKETKKKQATPLRKEIQKGVELKATKQKLATPLRKEIQSKPILKETKKKQATPLRKEIQKGVKLKATKQKLATPLRKEIQSKPVLRETKKKLATPLRQEIKSKPQLRATKKTMSAKLQDEIKQGVKLRETKKIMAYDLQIEIIKGKKLKETKKKMATPLREEIQKGVSLKKTLKSLPTPLKTEIASGVELRKSKKVLPDEIQDEIKQGKDLKKTMKKMQTPLRKEIEHGAKLRETKKRMTTPLKKEIQQGVELKKTEEMKSAPVESNTSSQSKRRQSAQGGNPSAKKLRTPRKSLSEVKAPQSQDGFKLRQRRLATPLRRDIHKSRSLRPVRRKSTRLVNMEGQSKRKPTYAEILKRPKKIAVRRLSSKRAPVTKFGPTALPGQSAKADHPNKQAVAIIKPASEEKKIESKPVSKKTPIVKEQETHNLQGVAELFVTPISTHTRVTRSTRKSLPEQDFAGIAEMFVTPQSVAKSTKKSLQKTKNAEQDLDGIVEMFVTPEVVTRKTRNTTGNWLDVIAKALPDAKPKRIVEEDLEGLKELFATPQEAVKKIKAARKKPGNWLDIIAKSLDEGKPKQSPVDLEGLQELFATPSKREKAVSVEPAKIKKTPSLRQVAMIRQGCQANGTPEMVSLSKPKRRLSRRSDETFNLALMSSPAVMSATPSLRSKDSQFLRVEALEECKTPSLRTVQETVEVTVCQALEPSKTPSIRSREEPLETVQPIEPCKTPSIRAADETITVFESVKVCKTPSLRIADGKTVRTKKNNQRKSVDYTGIKRLMKTPKIKHNVEDPESNYESSWFGSPSLSSKAPKTSRAVANVSDNFELVNNEFKVKKGSKAPRMRHAIANIEDNFEPSLFASPSVARSAKKTPFDSKKTTKKVDEQKEKEHTEVVVEDKPLRRTTRSKRVAPEPVKEPAKKRPKRENVSEEKPASKSKEKGRKPKKSAKKTSTLVVETPKPIVYTRTVLEPIPELPTPSTTPRVKRPKTVSFMSPTLEAIQERQQEKSGKADEVTIVDAAKPKSTGRTTRKNPMPNDDTTVAETKPTTRKTRGKKVAEPVEEKIQTTRSARKTRGKSSDAKENSTSDESSIGKDTEQVKDIVHATRTTRKTRGKSSEIKEDEKSSVESMPRSTRSKKLIKESEKTDIGSRSAKKIKDQDSVVELPCEETIIAPRPRRAARTQQKASTEEQKLTRRTRARKVTEDEAVQQTNKKETVVEVCEVVETLPKRRGRKQSTKETSEEQVKEPNSRSTRSKVKTDANVDENTVVDMTFIKETRKSCRSTLSQKENVVQEKVVVEPKTRGKRAAKEPPTATRSTRAKKAKLDVVVEDSEPIEVRPKRRGKEEAKGTKNSKEDVSKNVKLIEEKPKRGRKAKAQEIADEEPKRSTRGRKRQATKPISPSPKKLRMSTRSRK